MTATCTVGGRQYKSFLLFDLGKNPTPSVQCGNGKGVASRFFDVERQFCTVVPFCSPISEIVAYFCTLFHRGSRKIFVNRTISVDWGFYHSPVTIRYLQPPAQAEGQLFAAFMFSFPVPAISSAFVITYASVCIFFLHFSSFCDLHNTFTGFYVKYNSIHGDEYDADE